MSMAQLKEDPKINEKFNFLTDNRKVVQIINDAKIFSSEKIQNVDISILKSYKDQRSYSLVVLYKLFFESGSYQEITGIANSDGAKEYAWQITRAVFENFKPQKDFLVLRPYAYLKPYGLFLREYLAGQTLAEIIKKDKRLREFYSNWIIKWLENFQKIITIEKAKDQISFDKIENNFRILKQRGRKVSALERNFNTIRKKMSGWAKQCQPVLVHGDFNPFNVIISDKKLAVVDFENAHLGDSLFDIANFISHLMTLPDLEINREQRLLSGNIFIKSYEKRQGGLSEKEKEKLDVYISYFDLLAKTHTMVWGE